MKLRLSRFTVCSAFAFAFCAAQLPAQTASTKSATSPASADASDQADQKSKNDKKPDAAPASAANNQPASAAKPVPAPAQTAATSAAAQPAPASAPTPAVAAQTTPEKPHPNVKLASNDTKDHVAQKFIGQHIRSRDGSDLGALHDFLIDTQTGQADYAVVASGGFAGLGEKFRLVPLGALQRTGQNDEFRVDMTEEHWKQLATVDSKALEATPFTMSDSQHRRIAQNFEPRTDASRDADSGFYTASITRHFTRATALEGRDIGSSQNRLGKIEDVVIDFPAQKAQALVDPSRAFTGLHRKLVVPFSELAVGTGEHPQVTTQLTQADFQQLHGGTAMTARSSTATQPAPAAPASANPNVQVASNASPSAPPPATAKSATPAPAKNDTQAVAATSQDSKAGAAKNEQVAANAPAKSAAQTNPAKKDENENLTPTGKTSADAIPAGTNPALLASARAIRKALDDDPALAHANIQVTPENGRIVLRGRVNDQKTKTAVIEAATHEIQGWKFDDQISVDTNDTK